MRRAEVESLLPLLGDRARAFALPETVPPDGDVDCAVEQPDPLWPLRLGAEWRVCQSLWQGVHSRRWVLERGGELLALDLLNDLKGLGPDLFPTGLVVAGDGPLVPVGARAAYAAAKAIRKDDVSPERWRGIAELAREDEAGFRAALAGAMGGAGADVAEAALRGEAPSPALRRRARRAGVVRRLCNPQVAIRALGRAGSRLVRPTGLTVVVTGPDGSGKSSLADQLPEACGQLFRRSLRLHSRPRVLPRPGALLGRAEGDSSRPHAAPPHGRWLSSALLFYYWLDFALGDLLKVRPAKARTGLVVLERGWWDFLVDPRRYRLDPPPRLVRTLGAVLPRPDLVLVLDAPAQTLAARKAELPENELERQRLAWRNVPVRTAVVDAAAPAGDVLGAAREEIVGVLHDRALTRLGAGWTSLAGGRWQLPRGPRRAAHAALRVYQPVTVRSRVGWELARVFARVGGFRLLPRGAVPEAPVRERLAPHLAPRTTFAVSRGNAEGRFVALAVGKQGTPGFVAKIATTENGADALDREAEALDRLGGRLTEPLAAPRLIGRERGLLLLEPVAWHPRLLPWRLPPSAANALGRFAAVTGCAHGDCAPWNLLNTRSGWTLVDWEEAREAAPFTDVLHYLLRAHSHLGRPSLSVLRAGLEGRGWVGKALRAYADGAGIDVSTAAAAVDSLAPDEEIDDLQARRLIATALGR